MSANNFLNFLCPPENVSVEFEYRGAVRRQLIVDVERLAVAVAFHGYIGLRHFVLPAVFDITAQIIQGMQGFYVYGRGTKHLPSYINTMYRNKQKSFSYKWSSDKKFITEITIERWPFANDSDFASLKYTHIWQFTYYQ